MEKVLSKQIRKLRKKVWLPVTEEGDADIYFSKFAGQPFLKKDEEWPICKKCGKPMTFFLQINLKEIPGFLQKEWDMYSGILQMFYCTNNEPEGCGSDQYNKAFGDNVLLRIVDDKEEAREQCSLNNLGKFPPRKITRWKESFDYPCTDEISSLGIELGINRRSNIPFNILFDYAEVDIESENKLMLLLKKFLRINYPLDEKEVVWHILREVLERPLAGEKLGGWPLWIQNVNYPLCPKCGERMRFIFQIDSNKSLPHIFGDHGAGHITQCRTHKEVLGFIYTSC